MFCPKFGKSLTAEEINELLTNRKPNLHLGTINDNGYPNIYPVCYYLDSSKKKIYI
jgi:hypothetical protein